MSVQPVAAPQRRSRKEPIPSRRYGVMDPRRLNIIRQVRADYSDTDPQTRADNIASVGLLQAVGVAELDRKHAEEYLAHFGKVFGVKLRLRDVPVDLVTGYYYIVIWGHCRTQAGWLLWNEGCSACRARHKSKAAERCVAGHAELNPEGFDVRLFHNISPSDAVMKQLAENTYQPPARDREAAAIRTAWMIRKHAEPNLTIAAFARETGRSAAFVVDSLLFCLLPQAIQDSVDKGSLKFTAALEFARLQAIGMTKARIARIAQRAISSKLTVPQVGILVDNVAHQHLANAGMEELFLVAESERTLHRRLISSIVEEQAIRTLRIETSALKHVRDAQRNGSVTRTELRRSREVRKLLRLGDELRGEIKSLRS